MPSKILHEETLYRFDRSGGPSVHLRQRQSGRCALYLWWCDQDGSRFKTIAVWAQHDWQKALDKAEAIIEEEEIDQLVRPEHFML